MPGNTNSMSISPKDSDEFAIAVEVELVIVNEVDELNAELYVVLEVSEESKKANAKIVCNKNNSNNKQCCRDSRMSLGHLILFFAKLRIRI